MPNFIKGLSFRRNEISHGLGITDRRLTSLVKKPIICELLSDEISINVN